MKQHILERLLGGGAFFGQGGGTFSTAESRQEHLKLNRVTESTVEGLKTEPESLVPFRVKVHSTSAKTRKDSSDFNHTERIGPSPKSDWPCRVESPPPPTVTPPRR